VVEGKASGSQEGLDSTVEKGKPKDEKTAGGVEEEDRPEEVEQDGLYDTLRP
jgi:hypothetical protein